MPAQPDLAVDADDLTKLAGELREVQEFLDGQMTRMNHVVDRIEAQWKSPAATAYRRLHRDAAADAGTIRDVIGQIVEAVLMSGDNFTRQEIETLQGFRDIEAHIEPASAALPGPAEAPASAAPAAQPVLEDFI